MAGSRRGVRLAVTRAGVTLIGTVPIAWRETIEEAFLSYNHLTSASGIEALLRLTTLSLAHNPVRCQDGSAR